MATTGYITLTANAEATTWTLTDEDQETLAAGEFTPALDLEDEDFNFDGVTDRVATVSGHCLENDMRYTESDTGRLYWTVTFN